MARGQDAYTQEQATRWLSRLARGMQRHGQTVFLIEQLQPSWLPGWWRKAAYGLVTRYVDGLFVCLSLALMLTISDLSNLCLAPLVGAAVASLSLLFADFCLLRFATSQPIRSQAMKALIFFSWAATATAIAGAFAAAFFWFSPKANVTDVLIRGTPPALAFGIARRGIRRMRTAASDVSTVERLIWSWRGAILGLAVGAVSFVIFLFSMGTAIASAIARGLRSSAEPDFTADFLLYFLAFAAIFITALMPLRGAFRVAVREAKAAPNEGIRISIRNGLSVGWKTALGGTILALSTRGLLRSSLPLSSAFQFGMGYGLLAAIWYGGADVVRHYALRYLLAREGYLPWDLAAFLDFCTDELYLLQRVGGGYMFLHRYLLEYFAGLGEGVEVKEGPAATPAHSDAVAG